MSAEEIITDKTMLFDDDQEGCQTTTLLFAPPYPSGGAYLLVEKPIADGRSPTERLQPWLIAGLSIVLLSMAMISTWMVVALSKAAELRVDSYRHLSSLSQVVSMLQDAEASQRSYLISGDEKYLGPYQHAREELDRQFSQLHALIEDDLDQRRRASTLQAMATAKLDTLDAGLTARREREADAPRTLIDLDRDENVMASIRTLAAAMQEADQRTLALREQTVDRQRSRSLNTTTLSPRSVAYFS